MKKTVLILTCVLSLLAAASCAAGTAGESPVIPAPSFVEFREGTLGLENAVVRYDDKLAAEASFLTAKLEEAGIKTGKKGTKISLSLNPRLTVPGAYELETGRSGIKIAGTDPAGVFYGVVSLLQMIDAQGATLDRVFISDSPRYQWRGMHLDEARHFFGKEKVLQILDLMSYYKLNKLHWHLSDSEGWRIDILKYPRLGPIGGQGCWSDLNSTEARYYTQDDIREIVAYAAARHIEVIPEIDMPGHANASNKAYPEYSGGKDSKTHPDYTFNPGREETYAYLTDILREVAGLFPSPYLHLGGDEVSFGIDAWNTNPDVQALMKREGFTKLKEAERYFNARMADSARMLGKKLLAWDELVQNDAADPSVTITWWRHDKLDLLEKALTVGNKVVMCPRCPYYLDFKQDGNHKWGRIRNGQYNRLQDVYAFPDDNEVITGFPDAVSANILGLQANVWTERIPTAQRLDYMMWPRVLAAAESAWSAPENKDFADFERRLEYAYRLLDREGIYYYDHRNPERHPEAPGRDRKK